MNYLAITKDDILNFEGLRVVLWLAGCTHHCQGCHNPYSWDENAGVIFDNEAKQEIFEQLDKDYIAGITVSGGDSLYPKNREELTQLLKEIREKYPNKNICCYTGYTYEEVKDLEIMNYIDVLVDSPFIEELADVNYKWAGSTNQKIIDVQKSLKTSEIISYEEK